VRLPNAQEVRTASAPSNCFRLASICATNAPGAFPTLRQFVSWTCRLRVAGAPALS
jgi:hypothetical protein